MKSPCFPRFQGLVCVDSRFVCVLVGLLCASRRRWLVYAARLAVAGWFTLRVALSLVGLRCASRRRWLVYAARRAVAGWFTLRVAARRLPAPLETPMFPTFE